MSPSLRISVVIAAYAPGAAFDRVIDSLDAQTLPQDEFETIVIDDGSPDDTFERLTALAATRANMRVERIENSGWPSRPRNVATGIARGEHVFFMDHDDSLYPDALRRMAEYAAETRADVLSPKESKTSDAWWCMPALKDGNVPNAVVDGGIDRLLPMVPHKLYRRAFLQQHGIRFPEGRRQLWEDIYVNVAAWRHAERVAVLADTPVYLWHASASNNSRTYGPRDEEFWDRLDELLAFIDRTLDGPEHAEARGSALLHQLRGRVLLRLSKALQRADAAETAMAMRRARAIQARYLPEAWEPLLGRQVRARSVLLRADRPDLLAALWAVDGDTRSRVTATRMEWRDGRLHLTLEAAWQTKAGEPVGLVRQGDRLLRDLPAELRQALPDDVVDMTDTLPLVDLSLAVRDRAAAVTWRLPVEQEARWIDLEDGRVELGVSATAVLDPATLALGRPMAVGVHDLVATLAWDGAERASAVRFTGTAAPAVPAGGTVVAYGSRKGTLALDSSATLRNVLADGGAPNGPVQGDRSALRLPLPRIRVSDAADLPAAARLLPADGAEEVVLHGRFRADAAGAVLDLEAGPPLPDGAWTLGLRLGDGPFLGARRASVADGVLTLVPKAGVAPPPPPPATGAIRIINAVRRRLGG
ncbi:glycosyltransferase [uncultured Amnibacterium sp.]|uniref:glycosyltransferase n=1 Tax=uncultured Amnibacterium sp. TaxID=1631851 RepID=UPI0035C9447E